MKKIFVFLVLSFTLLFLTISCAKEADSLSETTSNIKSQLYSENDSIVTDYPPVIDDYVGSNYIGASIVEVELEDDGTYEVKLDNGLKLLFDADGNFIEEDLDDDEDEDYDNEEDHDYDEVITDYPAAIDEYIALNHPDTSIDEIELEDDGSYEVELADGTEIIFDTDGNFVEYDD